MTPSDATPSDDLPSEDFPRISTGNREVDQILGGGFPANSLNIIMGQPGTGKTIFVQQMVFHNASDERPVLYLTTLSEPLPKVIKYLQRFTFYDEMKLGGAVIYQDIAPELAEGGIGELQNVLKQAIKAIGPKVIVIDSFKALHDLSPSIADMRRMLYEVTSMLAAYETTVFLVGEYSEEHSRGQPEFAIADGIVQFLRQEKSSRDERFMRVLKLRGSRYAEGIHGFRIAASGLQVFPRLVSPEIPPSYGVIHERVPTGVPGFDALLGGGLWRGSTTLLMGPAGGGKTTVGAQFVLEGLRLAEPSLYINFQENPTQLARMFRNLQVDSLEAATSRGLHVIYESPVELQIDSVISRIFRMLSEHKLQRVVIDSLGDLAAAASDPQRLHDYMYALMQHFIIRGTTCIVTCEVNRSNRGTAVHDLFSYMSDNLIQLEIDIGPKIQRTVRVLKSRSSAHDLHAHEFQLHADGARVL
ncbi:MAG: AAA family ATPase [Nannocystis sp.]|nr:ATPase domain-containing protein [Nannocystis sp.]MBA3545650.1 AAA family ATPase [Nannocystis sp.]